MCLTQAFEAVDCLTITRHVWLAPNLCWWLAFRYLHAMVLSAEYVFSWTASSNGSCIGSFWDGNGVGPLFTCVKGVGEGVIPDVVSTMVACSETEEYPGFLQCLALMGQQGNPSGSTYIMSSEEVHFKCMVTAGSEPIAFAAFPSIISNCQNLQGVMSYDVSLSMLCNGAFTDMSLCGGISDPQTLPCSPSQPMPDPFHQPVTTNFLIASTSVPDPTPMPAPAPTSGAATCDCGAFFLLAVIGVVMILQHQS